MSNLIRNGGFERGDAEFWDVISDDTLAASTVMHLWGLYSGKITSVGTGTIRFATDDFLEVKPSAIVNLSFWVYGVAGKTMEVRIDKYNADGTSIGSETIISQSLYADWTSYTAQYTIDEEAIYIKVDFRILSPGDGDVYYFDDVSLIHLDNVYPSLRVTKIAQVQNAVASGDTTATKYYMLEFTDYYAEINCASLTGTTPTLDVDVCELDQVSNEVVLGSFAQIAAGGGDERISISNPIGKGMYVKYTEGGTWTDCDFEVSIIGVR